MKQRKNVFIALRMAGVGGRGKLDGILRYVDDHHLDWNIQIVRTSLELTRETIQDALDRKTDGYIISMPGSEDAVPPLFASKAPLVLSDTQAAGIPRNRCNLAVISNDAAAIGRAAAEHLLSQGTFAAFGYVYNDRTDWARNRLKGYAETLAERGFGCTTYAAPLNGTVVPDRKDLARWLKALPKPAALFVDCDDHAHSVLDICHESGIDVPQSVSVIGVGNDSVICLHSTPTLSSILPDFNGEGYLAARLLRGMMERPSSKCEPRFFLRGVADTVVRESSTPLTRANHLVLRALKFIDGNLSKKIGIDDVARHLKVSRSLLILRFREIRGESIAATIRSRRLAKVKSLLETTRFTIEEITEKCGFENANHLKNIFKSHFGRTMRDYRNSVS